MTFLSYVKAWNIRFHNVPVFVVAILFIAATSLPFYGNVFTGDVHDHTIEPVLPKNVHYSNEGSMDNDTFEKTYVFKAPTWQCSNYTQTETSVNVSSIKVMCLILVTLGQWDTKAKAVRDTWAKRCDKVWYIYSTHASSDYLPYPGVGMNIIEKKEYLTPKVMEGFALAYRQFSDQFDWFLKADDDTYIIMENLKLYLSQFNPENPHYIGRLFTTIPHGYNSGGAGYVLSKASTKIIADDKEREKRECLWDEGRVEDLDVGRCLAKFGIYPEKSTDESCRQKFHSDDIINSFRTPWTFQKYEKSGLSSPLGHPYGEKILSPWSISFHHVKPKDIYLYEYLIYNFQKAADFPTR